MLSSTPEQLGLAGKTLHTPGVVEALDRKAETISSPYISTAGNLIIALSQPVFADNGDYLGYIAGNIYLRKNHIIDRLLGEHHYSDGSYVYAIDHNRRLLYHPDKERVGTTVGSNAIVDAVLGGNTGHMISKNSQGISMLAGYAPLPIAGWGIVAQCPVETALAPLEEVMMGVLKDTALPALAIFALAWWLAHFIARPLTALADRARKLDQPETSQKIEKIPSWYFEASLLKKAILTGLDSYHHKVVKLNLDAQTDPLTGLLNRRGQDMALAALSDGQQNFCVIAIDIDHFKKVNDTWGHDVGDLILKSLSQAIRVCSRDEDLLCRSGGEEFLIILPGTSLSAGHHVAERLRSYVDSQQDLPGPGHITISTGVACWTPGQGSVDAVLKRADELLYRAKSNGRNRVEVAES